MRIAAKRLRYVLEITESCFGAEADAARRAVKDLQGVLGDIHDCDVMLPRVEGIPSLTTLLLRPARAALPRLPRPLAGRGEPRHLGVAPSDSHSTPLHSRFTSFPC